MLHPQKTKTIRAILSKLPHVSKEEAVLQHTNMRTVHITDMSSAEADALITSLRRMQGQTTIDKPGEKMRRSIIAMAHEMQWKLPNGKADMNRINGWCETFGYLKKRLNAYTEAELPRLVSQFQQVYKSLLKSI